MERAEVATLSDTPGQQEEESLCVEIRCGLCLKKKITTVVTKPEIYGKHQTAWRCILLAFNPF